MESISAIAFIKKYKTSIFLPIICVLQFLTSFYYDLWIVATACAVVLLIISPVEELIYYTIFFQMFSSCGNFSVIITFVSAGLIFIGYIIDLIKKRVKFYVVPFVITIFICVFCSSYFYKIDTSGIYQGASLITTFFVVYLIFAYKNHFKAQKCANYLVGGMIATIAISLISQLFQSNSSRIFDGLNESIGRLKLLTKNENSLSIYCSLALSYYVYAFVNRKGNFIKNILFSIVLISVGLSTLSKSFLVSCIIMMIYLFVMIIRKYKLKSFTVILPTLLILLVISAVLRDRISLTFGRFLPEGPVSFLDKITTGRSHIWTQYINETISTIPKMIFGVGFFNERLVKIGPHNLLLHLLYRMGFFGIILIGILIYYYYQSSEKQYKLTLKNCIPLIIFLLLSMVEGFL